MALSDLHLVVNPTGLPEAVCLAARRRRRAALSRVDLSGGCGSRCPATTIRSRARRACRKAPRHAPAGDRGETRARPVGLMADAEWRANPSDPAEPRRSRTGDRTAGRHGRSTSPSPIARSVGQPGTPLPLRANPQQLPEPQQPIMSPGIIGTQPGSGGGVTARASLFKAISSLHLWSTRRLLTPRMPRASSP
jgi:hypothetical protein